MPRKDSPGPIGGPGSYGVDKDSDTWKGMSSGHGSGGRDDKSFSGKEEEKKKPKPPKSLFDRALDFFKGDETDEEEEQQMVDDWYSIMTTPEDVLNQIAANEAQQFQTQQALSGAPVPGLVGAGFRKGVPALVGEMGDIPAEYADTEEAIRRMLEQQYEERAGFGGDVANAIQAVGSLAGPVGTVAGMGAGAWKASKVPEALAGLNEQMGLNAELNSTNPMVDREFGSKGGNLLPPSVPSSVRPFMPKVDPYANLNITPPDVAALLHGRNIQSLL